MLDDTGVFSYLTKRFPFEKGWKVFRRPTLSDGSIPEYLLDREIDRVLVYIKGEFSLERAASAVSACKAKSVIVLTSSSEDAPTVPESVGLQVEIVRLS